MAASPTITSSVTSSGRSPPFIAIPVGGTPVGSPAPCSAAAAGVLSTVGADVVRNGIVTVSPAAIVAAAVSVTLSVVVRVAVTVAAFVAAAAGAVKVAVVGKVVVMTPADGSVLVIVAAALVPGVTTAVAVGAEAVGVDVAAGC